MITKEDWVTWKKNEVTQGFVQALFNRRELYKEGMAEGAHDEDFQRTIGKCMGIQDALNYALLDFEIEGEIVKDEA